MTGNQFANIEHLDADLWNAADRLNELNQKLRAGRDLLLPRLMSGATLS